MQITIVKFWIIFQIIETAKILIRIKRNLSVHLIEVRLMNNVPNCNIELRTYFNTF